jgi:hypothetical protein
MTTFIQLLRTKFSRRQYSNNDDRLLCDIGLSRIVFEFQAAEFAQNGGPGGTVRSRGNPLEGS